MGEKNDVGYIALRLGKYRKQWKQLIYNEDKHYFFLFFFGGGVGGGKGVWLYKGFVLMTYTLIYRSFTILSW